jgi:hypothetical protein
VGNEGLQGLKDEQGRASPEDTRPKFLFRLHVIEQQARLGITGMQLEIIRYHQHNVNVIWRGFGCDIAPEDHQTCQFACGAGKLIDTPETSRVA